MRVVDILCVVVVTKLFVTSDVFSTPADYLTHSLISVDTHDAVRALRVGDESDIQEERAPSSFDPVLRYIPGTAANHEAAEVAKVAEIAEVARVENLLEWKRLSDAEHNDYFEKLLTTEFEWQAIERLLVYKVEPKHLRLFLEKYGKSENIMKSILVPYTRLYKKLVLKKSKNESILFAAADAVESFRAEEKVRTAIGIPMDGVKGWSESLLDADTEWDQFNTMVLKGVHPDDLRMTLQENGMEEPKVDLLVGIYGNMYHTYRQVDNPLREARLVQVADDIVATAPRNQG